MTEAERAKLFLDNLQDLMGKREREEIGRLAGLDREGRKWLKRVCDSGLARINGNTQKYLAKLAKALGVSITDFWLEQVKAERVIERSGLNDRWMSLLKFIAADPKEPKRLELLNEIRHAVDRWTICQTAITKAETAPQLPFGNAEPVDPELPNGNSEPKPTMSLKDRLKAKKPESESAEEKAAKAARIQAAKDAKAEIEPSKPTADHESHVYDNDEGDSDDE